MAKHMTWLELAREIMAMDTDTLNEEAQVFLEDMHYMEYGTAGLWPIERIVIDDGFNHVEGKPIKWGFITIDTEDEEDEWV